MPVDNNGLQSLNSAAANSEAITITSSPGRQQRYQRKRKIRTASYIIAACLFLTALLFGIYTALEGATTDNRANVLSRYKEHVPVRVLSSNESAPTPPPIPLDTVNVNGNLSIAGNIVLSEQASEAIEQSLTGKVDLTVDTNTAQIGNIVINGSMIASNFQGNGTDLSNLNASSLTTGTISTDRLDPSVTKLGQTIPLGALQSTVLSSLNGISNNGNVDVVGSGLVTVTTDTLNNQIIISAAASGDITSVTAGTGLTGGGSSGDVTLNVDTGVVTVQGNTFNGANQLVQLNGAGELPVLSGINLTNLDANAIVTGTLSDSRLSSNATLQGNTFNLPNKLVQLDVSGYLPGLNGSALTNLNANSIATGTLTDSRLSANVALLNANQTFSGNVVFSQPLTVNTIQPSASMTIGAINQSLTLQGDMSTSLSANNGVHSVNLGFSGTPTGDVFYTLDGATTPGTYTLCSTVGNCAGAGGGVTTIGGTTNKLVKFTGSQSVGDSSITDAANLVTIASNGLFKAGSDSTTAFRVQNASGATNVFTVDTTNTRVAIGQPSASYALDVNGDINSSTGLRVGGTLVCDSTGCVAGSNSGFYIQNGATLQTAANFNIESASNSAPTAVLKAKTGQSADILQAKDGSGNVVASIDTSGNIDTTGQYQVNGSQISSSDLSNDSNLAKLNGTQTFTGNNTLTGTVLQQNAADSTSAFQIQNSAGTSNLLIADTTNTRIGIGTATPGYTLDVNGDINITTGSSYRINGIAICGPTATCAPASGSSSYIQNSVALQSAANFNIQSVSASSVVAVIQGAAGQSTALQEWRDGSGNTRLRVHQSGNKVDFIGGGTGSYSYLTADGNLIVNASSGAALNMGASYGAQLGYGNQKIVFGSSGPLITGGAQGYVGLRIQGVASQVADLLQLQDSSSNVLAKITKDGYIFQGSNQVCDTSNNCGYASGSGSGNYIQNGTNTQVANFNIQSASSSSVGATIQGASGQTANLLNILDGSGTNRLKVDATGNVGIGINVDTSNGVLTVQRAPGQNALVIQGPGAYPGNLLEWRDSSGNTLLGYIDRGGNIYGPGRSFFANRIVAQGGQSYFQLGDTSVGYEWAFTSFNRQFQLRGDHTNAGPVWPRLYYSVDNVSGTMTKYAIDAASPSFILQGAAGQTGNLQEWHDSAGVVKASLNASGKTLTLGEVSTTAGGSTIYLRGSYNSGSNILTLSSGGSDAQVMSSGSVNSLDIGTAGQHGVMFNASGGRVGQFNAYGLRVGGPTGAIQAQLDVYNQASSRVGLKVRGYTGQTADLQQWQDSAGTQLGSVSNNGYLSMDRGFKAISSGAAGGSYSLGYSGTAVASWLSDPVTEVGNAVFSPATGRTIYFKSSAIGDTALKVKAYAGQTADLQQWQDSTGTILAALGPTGNLGLGVSPTYKLHVVDSKGSAADTWVARFTNSSTASNSDGVLIESGGNSDTSNQLLVQTTSGYKLLAIQGNGFTNIGNVPLATNIAKLAVVNDYSNYTAFAVRGSSGQTADLQQWQNSSGTVLSRVNSAGAIQLGFNVAIQGEHSGGGSFVDLIKRGPSNTVLVGNTTSDTTLQGGTYLSMSNASGNGILLYSHEVKKVGGLGYLGTSSTPWNMLFLQASTNTATPLYVKGANTQTADLQQWQNNAGTVLSRINNNGTFVADGGITTSVGNLVLSSAGGQISTGNNSTFNAGGSQYLEASYSSKTVKLASHGIFDTIYIGHNGISGQAGNVLIGQSSGTANARLHVKGSTNMTSSVGMIVQGATGQTGDLLQAQDSTGTVLAKIDASGNLTVKNATVQGDLTVTGNTTLTGNYISFSSNMRGYNITVTASATSQNITFNTAHPDANYAVFCTPDWNTNCYVTNKTTTGFTLNYGTAAPASQLVDWFVAR